MTETDILGADQIVILVDINIWAGMDNHGVKIGIEIMFIISPLAGKNLFNNAQLGEYFRVFVCYAVIAVALALHAWKTTMAKKAEEENTEEEKE